MRCREGSRGTQDNPQARTGFRRVTANDQNGLSAGGLRRGHLGRTSQGGPASSHHYTTCGPAALLTIVHETVSDLVLMSGDYGAGCCGRQCH